MANMLMVPAFKDLDPIIVAPDSLEGPWNSEINKTSVSKLLEFAKKSFPIDTDKTLVSGFSMGGHGTWVVASEYQDFFKAAIPIAGRGVSERVRTETEWTIPMYVIHSKADKVVPIGQTKEFVDKVVKQGANVKFVEVEGLPHFETYRFAEPLKESMNWLKEVWGGEVE